MPQVWPAVGAYRQERSLRRAGLPVMVQAPADDRSILTETASVLVTGAHGLEKHLPAE